MKIKKYLKYISGLLNLNWPTTDFLFRGQKCHINYCQLILETFETRILRFEDYVKKRLLKTAMWHGNSVT